MGTAVTLTGVLPQISLSQWLLLHLTSINNPLSSCPCRACENIWTFAMTADAVDAVTSSEGHPVAGRSAFCSRASCSKSLGTYAKWSTAHILQGPQALDTLSAGEGCPAARMSGEPARAAQPLFF